MMFRIQKLLMFEYNDFEEIVLVESPFAQVSETGKGVRQVQIALTPTKLIIGADCFDKNNTESLSNVFYQQQDPEIECMELTNIFPLDFLYIKIFRRKRRQLMKVAIAGYKILLFEFGGHMFRNLYWNIWRDRVAALRTYQNKFFGQIDLSTSSSSEIVPKMQLVVADVHRDASAKVENFQKHHKNGTDALPIHTVKTTHLESDPLKHSPISLKSGASSTPLPKRNNRTLREVAQYLLKTQSEIITHGDINEVCNGNYLSAKCKSTSLGNFYSCTSTGW